MILYSEDAIRDLQLIKEQFGEEEMVTLLNWCESLGEPATRLEAVRLSASNVELFRLRVDDFHIIFRLEDGDAEDVVAITNVRNRRR